ncbi:MAG: imidazolonepropionase, partial [Mariniphaga sp.]|nr:imidazolonepropionase [Mariniphaga sp.]
MLLLENIKELIQVRDEPVKYIAGKDMSMLPTIKNAFLLINDELIEDYGPMEKLAEISCDCESLIEIDCSGRMVFPSFCDSHTHIVFPAARDSEFVDKIKGLSYEEIARRGGGILNSA